MSKQARTTDGATLLQDINQFLARYLQCSEHQRVVLALWVLHTYCHDAAQVTPYLSIQSAGKQSGKTLCLQLLSLLCENPTLTSGLTVSNLVFRMKHNPASAILLDECQATIGTRRRSKAPSLRALLASSFHRGLGYSEAAKDQDFFCPKAFAGMGQLPEELADRSLPIILQPLKRAIAPFMKPAGMSKNPEVIDNVETVFRSPGHPITGDHPMIERFHLSRARQEARPLRERLSNWAGQHLPILEKMSPYSEQDFPPGLSPRRQDLCEPLLQIAHVVGGLWPARLGEALITLLAEEAAFQLQTSLQLLEDIHHCFFFHSFPERLSTNNLLDWVHTLPARAWDAEGPLTARSLARLLAALDIRPRLQRIGSDGPARGYQLHDFLEPWRRHLGIAPIHKVAAALPPDDQRSEESKGAQPFIAPAPLDKQDLDLAAGSRTLEAAPSSIQNQKSEIPRNDAPCNTIPDLIAIAVPAATNVLNTHLPMSRLQG